MTTISSAMPSKKKRRSKAAAVARKDEEESKAGEDAFLEESIKLAALERKALTKQQKKAAAAAEQQNLIERRMEKMNLESREKGLKLQEYKRANPCKHGFCGFLPDGDVCYEFVQDLDERYTQAVLATDGDIIQRLVTY